MVYCASVDRETVPEAVSKRLESRWGPHKADRAVILVMIPPKDLRRDESALDWRRSVDSLVLYRTITSFLVMFRFHDAHMATDNKVIIGNLFRRLI